MCAIIIEIERRKVQREWDALLPGFDIKAIKDVFSFLFLLNMCKNMVYNSYLCMVYLVLKKSTAFIDLV